MSVHGNRESDLEGEYIASSWEPVYSIVISLCRSMISLSSNSMVGKNMWWQTSKEQLTIGCSIVLRQLAHGAETYKLLFPDSRCHISDSFR